MITSLLLIMAVLAALLAIPAFLLARVFKAKRSKYGFAFTATLLQFAVSVGVQFLPVGQPIQHAILLFAGALIYSFSLGLRLLKGFAIALMVAIIHLALTTVFFASVFHI
jgi:hypothetical protein